MNKNNYRIRILLLLILAFLIIIVMMRIFKQSSIEGLVNLDSQYLDIKPRILDASGFYVVPSNHYKVGTDQMALIPPGYITTPDKTGIVLDVSNIKNSDIIYDIKQDSDGNYNVPTGYYSLNSNKMAIIPYGFHINDNKTGISLNPLMNVINAPISQNSPTSNLTNASANSLIKYNSNNFGVKYHDDISANNVLGGVQPKTIYYQPGTFKYGGSSYVPSYEDSVYLSKNTYLPKSNVRSNSSLQSNIDCEKYKYEPSKIEDVCNKLSNKACRSSNCCLLLGGQKCVAGNEQGPTMKYEYSNYLIKNRDYYYYKGKCFGNCPFYETDMPE